MNETVNSDAERNPPLQVVVDADEGYVGHAVPRGMPWWWPWCDACGASNVTRDGLATCPECNWQEPKETT